MPKTTGKSSVYADIKDLLSIKKKVNGLMMPATRKMALHGIGATRSPFRTRGLDFQEVRAYQPGDDIRQIDWRVTAKYGKPFTKLYTDEKERAVFFICDMRTSMKFATQGRFKSVIVARVAAFLSFLALQKSDTVGFMIIKPNGIKVASPEMGENTVVSFLKALSDASNPQETAPDDTTLAQAFKEIQPHLRRGALVFVLSDFMDLTDEAVALLPRLTTGRTVSLIHIYDSVEADLPNGVFPITDGTSIRFLDITADKKAYQSGFKAIQNTLTEAVQKYRLGYLNILTQEADLDKVVAYTRGVFTA